MWYQDVVLEEEKINDAVYTYKNHHTSVLAIFQWLNLYSIFWSYDVTFHFGEQLWMNWAPIMTNIYWYWGEIVNKHKHKM